MVTPRDWTRRKGRACGEGAKKAIQCEGPRDVGTPTPAPAPAPPPP
eukprot:CAMPEP_0171112356 /NCGR_PEP_ID=MMETSP0766_2-20121228/78900_1 /TAXON_ID=439317 /ORGANISM="Gambierdiscus australes, Strain CAWD 149" /LENGTH=45 /DNA_ID= /DNA_START= /DNA_END= /DNA_ORIENTATION=